MEWPSDFSARAMKGGFPGLCLVFIFILGSFSASAEPITSGTSPLNIPETGTLSVTVESVYERTPRMYSILAKRVELWISDRRVASISKKDPGVTDGFHRRIFFFPPIAVKKGFHFVSIRAFAEGFLSREDKWKGRIIQFGIRPGKETRIRITLPFHVW